MFEAWRNHRVAIKQDSSGEQERWLAMSRILVSAVKSTRFLQAGQMFQASEKPSRANQAGQQRRPAEAVGNVTHSGLSSGNPSERCLAWM
jgi:hypothetical protein